MQHQFTFALPEDIPLPKYKLFQRVSVTRYWEKFTYEGVIVGVAYTDFRAALMERGLPGWCYTISLVYGVSEEEALKAFDITDIAIEEDITLLEQEVAR